MKKEPKPIDLDFKKQLDDLFTSEQERQDAKKPKVEELPLEELFEFEGHPFQVKDDEEMSVLVESMKAGGVLTPAIVRPREGGGYEVISGHRRLLAARKLGLDTIPAIAREMTDAEAIVAMVDANLQREHILPSEKAFAYKLKLEALAHQGATCGQVGHKSRDEISAEESGRQVQRYIRLTYLIKPILDMVDEGKVAMSPAVELSYLPQREQEALLDAMEEFDCTPSHAQARRMRACSQAGFLDSYEVRKIMAEEKANQIDRLRIPMERIRQFFPKSYTAAQIEEDIVKMCEARYLRRQRDTGAR